MDDVQADITQKVQEFYRQYAGDLTAVTFRIIKDSIAPKFEDWSTVLEKHKAFIKAEAVRLASETPDKCGGEGEKSSFETPGKVEADSKAKDLKTTTKKEAREESTSQRKKVRQDVSESDSACKDGSDDADSEGDEPKPKKQKKATKKETKEEESSKRKKVRQEASDSESASTDGSDDADSEDDEPKPKKQKKTSKKDKKPTSNPEKKAKPESSHSAEVKRLKEIAKKLGVAVPVNVYKGSPSNDELEERLGEFLLGQGLSSLKAGPREISRLRDKIQLARELDGIDTTNIVRGRRRGQDEEEEAGGSATGKYRIRPVSDSEDDSS